MSISC